MGRRNKARYSRLFEGLRNLKGASPAAGSREAAFLDHLQGGSKIVQANKIPVEGRQLYNVGLIPFAVSAADETAAERYKALMSAYSLLGLANRCVLGESDFGIYKIEGGEDSNPNYLPALLRAKYSASGATVQDNKVSAVTKEEYKYEYGRTFSFPFGRTTVTTEDAEDGTAITTIGAVDELDVLTSLKTKIVNSADDTQVPKTLSYEPEDMNDSAIGEDYTTTTTLPTVAVN